MCKQALVALSTVLVAAGAAAHPGHGAAGQGETLAHYLAEPLHVIGALAVLLVGAAAARVLGRQRRGASSRDRGGAS